MCVLLLVVLLHLQVAEGSAGSSLTIDDVRITALPSNEVNSGDNITIACFLNISTFGHFTVDFEYKLLKDYITFHTVKTSDKIMQFKIAPAWITHSGIYQCHVKAQEKEKESTELKINVKGVSQPELSVSKSEVIEGEPVHLTCLVKEEYAFFLFSFYIASGNKDPKVKKIRSYKNVAKITLTDWEDKTVPIIVRCQAELLGIDGAISPKSETRLIAIKDVFATPKINIWPSNNVTEADNVNITCTGKKNPSFRGPFEIILKEGHRILATEKNNEFVSYLLRSAKINDSGIYECMAESSTVSKKDFRHVYVGELFSKPSFKICPSSAYRNRTISCTATFSKKAQNATADIMLLKDDNVQIHRRLRITEMSETLQYKTQESAGGTYLCKVTLKNITKLSENCSLSVPASIPEFSYNTKSTKVLLGENVTMSCYSKQGTPPVQYKFYRGVKLLGIVTMNKPQPATLTVTVDSVQHTGEYRCTAENSITIAQHSKQMQIRVIVPIRTASLLVIPENGEVEDGKELIFVCSANNGSWPITFSLYRVKEQKPPKQRKENAVSAAFFHKPVSSETQGQYYCTATNNANMTAQSPVITITVLMATWKKILIAGIILTVLAVIIFLVYYNHFKKQKALMKNVEISKKTATMDYNMKPASEQINEQDVSHITIDETNNVNSKVEKCTDETQDANHKLDG
ncbi:platelet endothelial cell adhesion molecule-like isoform X2 [Protopterus annectens]|uniref:platelet endothelial cell adhesion molecule-like isoform X2 n=1 Tax=Protopterus annectens TaxID=7888 RepID=UPI001CFB0CB8|nr:platelet endothelial cell adhesion molecule-like isoform X2 [Protopterus annectens]